MTFIHGTCFSVENKKNRRSWSSRDFEICDWKSKCDWFAGWLKAIHRQRFFKKLNFSPNQKPSKKFNMVYQSNPFDVYSWYLFFSGKEKKTKKETVEDHLFLWYLFFLSYGIYHPSFAQEVFWIILLKNSYSITFLNNFMTVIKKNSWKALTGASKLFFFQLKTQFKSLIKQFFVCFCSTCFFCNKNWLKTLHIQILSKNLKFRPNHQQSKNFNMVYQSNPFDIYSWCLFSSGKEKAKTEKAEARTVIKFLSIFSGKTKSKMSFHVKNVFYIKELIRSVFFGLISQTNQTYQTKKTDSV